MMKKVQFTDVIDLVTVTGGCMLGDKQERERYHSVLKAWTLLWTIIDVPHSHLTSTPFNIFGALKTEKAKHSVISQEALWNAVRSCWDNMSQQVLHKLVESMQLKCMLSLKQKVDGLRHSDIHGQTVNL